MNLLDQEQLVQEELAGDELVLWTGQPDPWRAMKSAYGIFLSGLGILAFMIFWIAGAASMAWSPHATWQNILFPLFGIPFAGLALGMVLSPLWHRKKARRTIYAITWRGALIVIADRVKQVRRFEQIKPDEITRVELSDGSGDLFFATGESMLSRSWWRFGPSSGPERLGFLGVPGVREVERVLRDVIATRAEAGASVLR